MSDMADSEPLRGEAQALVPILDAKVPPPPVAVVDQPQGQPQGERRHVQASAARSALKVGWLTPYGPRSDVGTFSRAILQAAAETTTGDIDLIPVVNANGPTYFHPGPMLRLDGALDEELVQSFDTVVYNIGNNVENHGHINRLALRYPGVVLVHDLVMQHYIAWEVFERLRDPAVYADLIASHYGTRGLEALAASRICASTGRPRYAPWDSVHAIDMPLIEPFIRSAAAVVVNSEFAEEQVRRFCRAPLLRLGLPHDQKPALSDAEIAAWGSATRRRDRVAFTAFGHIGRGKCLRLAIEAFRERPELAATATLTIAGYPTDQAHVDELKDLVRALDLTNVVRFELAVSPDRLQQLKREADVFVNLRWPNTESASGSLVEQLNTAKPALVYASGCYAEVPADAAFQVSTVNSVPALAAAMLDAARSPERRVAVGLAGAQHARRMSAAGYVGALGGFLQEHRTLLRDRQGMHRRLRAIDPARLATQLRRPDVAWARGLAVARDAMAPILDGAPGIGPRPFLQLDEAALRGFIVIGLFGQTEVGVNPGLLVRLDEMLAVLGRIEVFRAVRQAAELKRWLEGASQDPPPDLGPPEPEAMELLACFGPELFAAACYVLILGRAPAPNEPAGYAARLSHGESAVETVREMLASKEFAARKLTAAAVERLRLGAGRAAAVLRPPPLQAPGLAPGQILDISNQVPPPRDLLLGPWHPPEPNGVWSAGAVSRLAFRLPANSPPGQVLRLRFRLPMRPGEAPRTLRAFLPGGLAQTMQVGDGDWRDMLVPLPPGEATGEPGGEPSGPDRTLVLALDAQCAVPASEAGNPNDQRRLGVMLAALELIPAEPDADAVAALRVLDPADPIDFVAHRPPETMLAEGWHGVEPNGVWSDGASALLRFGAPSLDGLERILRLRLSLPAAPENTPRRLSMVLDGVTSEAEFTADERVREVALILQDWQGPGPSRHELRIDCAAPFRPSEVGDSADSRLLGVRLLSMELQAGAAAGADAP